MTSDTEVQLTAIKFGVRKVLSGVFIRDVSVETNRICEDMYELYASGKLWGQTNIKEYSFQYPENWREAVKERFAPAWLLKRFPVKYKNITVSVDAVYPELHKKLKLPNEPARFVVHGSEE